MAHRLAPETANRCPGSGPTPPRRSVVAPPRGRYLWHVFRSHALLTPSRPRRRTRSYRSCEPGPVRRWCWRPSPASGRTTWRCACPIPGPDSLETPVTGSGIVALPYDRDSVLRGPRGDGAAASSRPPRRSTASSPNFAGPSTAIPAPRSGSASSGTRSPWSSTSSTPSARDTPQYSVLYARFTRLTDSLEDRGRPHRRGPGCARQGEVDLRRAAATRLRAAVRQWEDSTYRGIRQHRARALSRPRRGHRYHRRRRLGPPADQAGAVVDIRALLGCDRPERGVVLERAGHARTRCSSPAGPAAASPVLIDHVPRCTRRTRTVPRALWLTGSLAAQSADPAPLDRRGRRARRGAGDRVRDVGLPVPVLPAVRARDLSAARFALRRHRKGSLGLHQFSAHVDPSECGARGAASRSARPSRAPSGRCTTSSTSISRIGPSSRTPRTTSSPSRTRRRISKATLTECVKSPATNDEVRADAEGASRAGATSTPTFYIEGGLLVGAQPRPIFRHVLDSIYAEKTGQDGGSGDRPAGRKKKGAALSGPPRFEVSPGSLAAARSAAAGDP